MKKRIRETEEGDKEGERKMTEKNMEFVFESEENSIFFRRTQFSIKCA